jgi:hypothetical protein
MLRSGLDAKNAISSRKQYKSDKNRRIYSTIKNNSYDDSKQVSGFVAQKNVRCRNISSLKATPVV